MAGFSMKVIFWIGLALFSEAIGHRIQWIADAINDYNLSLEQATHYSYAKWYAFGFFYAGALGLALICVSVLGHYILRGSWQILESEKAD